MRLALLAAAASAAFVFGSMSAEATPLVPLVADGGRPAVTLVDQGCGLGYSRGSRGRCRSSQFGFSAPGARRFGYGGVYGYRRHYARPYVYGYRRPYRYGY